ncbi:testis-expressed protein 19.1-like [Mus pahari]|uniref:testis-expressed protein 19.1-like n=1 Tax=Mus pahari TaxID=10093 RepID=UPI000A30E387|nr:testis-expressed protein 19.1-like [Mus pahari]
MCPPVSIRHGARGMSCLYGAWLYHLVHGEQMKICFACFKAAFLLNKLYLEMGDWQEEEEEEEEEDAELLEYLSESESESDSEQEPEPEQDAWRGLGPLYVPQGVSEGSGVLLPTPAWTQDVLFSIYVPTELFPQEAVPLDLGPEDAEWTQALPWRFDGLFPCSHQLIPPLTWWDIFDVMPSPGQPVLLELRCNWPLDQTDLPNLQGSLSTYDTDRGESGAQWPYTQKNAHQKALYLPWLRILNLSLANPSVATTSARIWRLSQPRRPRQGPRGRLLIPRPAHSQLAVGQVVVAAQEERARSRTLGRPAIRDHTVCSEPK